MVDHVENQKKSSKGASSKGAPQGAPQGATEPQGAAPQGAEPQGATEPQGAAPQGAEPQGAAPQGTPQGATDPATDPKPEAKPEPTEAERLQSEIDALDAKIVALKGEISAAQDADDDVRASTLSADRAAVKRERERKLGALGAAKFAPDLHAAIVLAIGAGTVAPPVGRYSLTAIFEGGKCIGVNRVQIEGASGIPAAKAAPSTVRANLKASASGIDPRVPSVGFSTEKTSHGVTWRITMVEPGVAEATSPGQETIKGSLGHVGRVATRQPTCDPYNWLHLGTPFADNERTVRTVWDDAKPAKGWAKI